MKNTISTTFQPKNKAFKIGLRVLLVVFCLQLLFAGFSLCLKSRVVYSYVPTEVIKEVIVEIPASPQGEESVPTVRTVRQMLQDETTDSADNVADLSNVSFLSESSTLDRAFEQPSPPQASIAAAPVSKVDQLVKEADSARIEGDIKQAVLKLEQALLLDDNHPGAFYCYGLCYEHLRNAEKSREYFLKVYTMREKAGPLFEAARFHLRHGFSKPADFFGSMSLGVIRENREMTNAGEQITLTIPIYVREKQNLNINDITVKIRFFDLVNGKTLKEVYDDRQELVAQRSLTGELDWNQGEEIFEASYLSLHQTEDEINVFGELKYYGYVIELYYKGEPMHCATNSPVIMLDEKVKASKAALHYDSNYGIFDSENSLLPPPDEVAEPASDALLPF